MIMIFLKIVKLKREMIESRNATTKFHQRCIIKISFQTKNTPLNDTSSGETHTDFI